MAFPGLLGGKLGYWLLCKLVQNPAKSEDPFSDCRDQNWEYKLKEYFGDDFRPFIVDKVVLDYGCGSGKTVLCLAQMGAHLAIGMDINVVSLGEGRKLAEEANLGDKCTFINAGDHNNLLPFYGKVDVLVSIDAFEHYSDPERSLLEMWRLTRPGGSLFISFGPPWWHPYGCHMMFMSAPPWTHVLFKERTIMAVRSLYRFDGAQRFEDVEGGLNRMTIRRFEHLITDSGFIVKTLSCVPIRGMALLAGNQMGREFFTSVARAHLVKPGA
jgi:SAM-dependent methyltransferase